ncbi:hypothetical protein [Labedaea rhizosphaerae]|uniref:Secreted protein n=1 Tax=Labedaea rhizosphaerae TaxID=598644 RepID=A0A4V3CZP9_LABRH|nr:hypothetical protein [Labedaea rhizosphaerae]TDQ00581.1 hypothetical protein EV186_102442 [Labedaea rhizosphaerae]
MLKSVFAISAATLAAAGVLTGGSIASAAPAAAAVSCPHNGGDSLHFTGKYVQRSTTLNGLTIKLMDGYNPADGKQYAWTYVQNASANDQAWVAYSTNSGSSYIQCGRVYVTSAGAFYTDAFQTSSSSSVAMKGCAEDVSANTSKCTTKW